ncbi:hypothetical protein C9374_000397 [Naegleria lovaniensis]|uniref:Uncharacterized protein n=1 Tax=Naegleria lovaniensis TaxID=51637 RepID=A0AA88GXL2_NAELO|nr:uncharacterized protein C9374_013183 [Naegleria lovaniensis]XP_044552225.1 uncharacterized protein C9374_000397 [Naegleria lovaniensis]KAG2372731.1 hypothetical protein C9374_013183 [Naegleria lovaniensis]KAG2388233.1 hypothetical protein C9374_000397 [Naegleria lovaniensis]
MSTPPNKLSVKVEGNQLIFYNPNNEVEDNIGVTFHRTLRIPDDGKIYPLPPSLGSFPVKRVDDYLDRVPEAWKKQGGVFIPLYQREAMWLEFMNFNSEYPHALKIAVGKVNALSGETWDEQIKQRNVQDYVVTPLQPWLDGINAGDGYIKQFVAMPLGGGYTVEGQVTGEEKVGGTQIIAYAPHHDKRLKQFPSRTVTTLPSDSKPKQSGFGFFSKSKKDTAIQPPSQPPKPYSFAQPCSASSCLPPPPPSVLSSSCSTTTSSYVIPPPMVNSPMPQCESASSNYDMLDVCCATESSMPMPRSSSSSSSIHNQVKLESKKKRKSENSQAKELGLAAGGKMKQQIIEDPYGYSFWDESTKSRIFIHIVNSEMYKEITGEEVPPTPITAQTYSSYNYPWFDFYNEDVGSVGKSNILSQVKTVKEIDQEKYAWPQQNDSSVTINNVTTYKGTFNKNDVRDGDW